MGFFIIANWAKWEKFLLSYKKGNGSLNRRMVEMTRCRSVRTIWLSWLIVVVLIK